MKTAFIRLIRVRGDKEHGTFGVLKINEDFMCVCMEPPDKENKSNVSNIPTGQYICEKFHSPTFGPTWIVKDVTDRSYILFHAGNTVVNTAGCILVAEHFGKLGDNHAVLNSGKTFKKFLEYMDFYELGHLTVMEAF